MFEQTIVDLVDIGKIVDASIVRGRRSRVLHLGELNGAAVRIVQSDFIVEDAVKTNFAEIRNLFHGTQVFAVAVAQRKDGSTGAEGLPQK